MKKLRTPAVLLVLLYIGFLAFWAWSGPQLPSTVATHFDGRGTPNGWMSRASHQTFVLAFGLGLPLLLAAVFYLTRFLPAWAINIPDRTHWLAPEKRQETANYLARHGLWLSCMAVLFVTGIQYSILEANRLSPPHLSTSMLLVVVVPFFTGMALWLVILLRHFRRRS